MKFQPYQIVEDTSNEAYEVRMWALTPNLEGSPTEPCVVRVKNCFRIFYLEFPQVYYRDHVGEVALPNEEQTVDILRQELYKKFPEISVIEICYRQKLNVYENDVEYPMFRVYSNSPKLFTQKTKRILSEYGVWSQTLFGRVVYNVIEWNIGVVSRAMVDYDFNYTSWLEISSYESVHQNDKVSTLDLEVMIGNFGCVSVVDDAKLYTTPKILSFDFETYSPKDNIFTDPENQECVLYMCSFAMKERDGSLTRKLLMIGPLLDDNGQPWQPDSGYEVVYVENESQFIHRWSKMIQEMDPDVITGYNINKFDNNYINARANLLGVYIEDVARLLERGQMFFKRWESETRAYGKQSLVYVEKIEGMIMVDLLPFIEKQYRLPSYKLNYVAEEFLKDKKDDVTAPEMFDAFRRQHGLCGFKVDHKPMIRVADYCMKDSDLVIRLIDKLNLWNATIETSKVVDVGCQDLYIRGQQIRCFNVLQKEANKFGYIMENRKDAPKYFIQGAVVIKPIPGHYSETVVFDFASLYPIIIIANNICFSTLVLDDSIPDEYCNIIETTQLEPKDFSKLKKDYFGELDSGAAGADDDQEITDEQLEGTKKKKTVEKIEVKYRIRFLKKEVKAGILPKIVSDLVEERRRVRALKANTNNVTEQDILEARQLALKQTCNSCYGFTGIQDNAKYRCHEIAIAITGWGRKYILQSIDVINNNFKQYGGRVVYGDTDSTFAIFPNATKEELLWLREEVPRQVEALLPRPMQFEYEKTYSEMLILKKKNYAGFKYNGKEQVIMENGTEKIFASGIEIARRDKFAFMKEIQETIIRIILGGNARSDKICLLYLISRCCDLIKGKFEPKEMTAVKKMGANYKGTSNFMYVFSEKLGRLGKKPQSGEQLLFIIVETANPGDSLGERAILFEDYTPADQIDIGYYLGLLVQPVDKIFSVVYGDKYKDFYPYDPKYSRFSKISGATPMKLIHGIVRDCKKLPKWRNEALNTLNELRQVFMDF